MAQDIGLLLRGLGAAVTNQVPQFRQELAQRQQQQELERQRAREAQMQDFEMMQQLQNTTFQDAQALSELLKPGVMNIEGALSLLEDRQDLIGQIGINLPNDPTPMLYENLRRAAIGDANALNTARNMAGALTVQGINRGVLKLPEEKVYRPGDVVYQGGKQAFEIPAAPTQQAATFRMLTSQEVQQQGLEPGNYQINERTRQVSRVGAPSTVVNVGEGGATPKFFENIDQQFAATLETAATSASSRPQLEMLSQLAPLTTTGAIPAQISRIFPTFNDANAAFIGITNQVLPSLRIPGSGAQSDKDIDVLKESIGNLGATTEVKQLLIQSLIAKDEINQQRANIAEQYAAGEITRAEAIRKDRELKSRSILPGGLQGALNAVSGMPKSARDEGITIDEWQAMSPAIKSSFK